MATCMHKPHNLLYTLFIIIIIHHYSRNFILLNSIEIKQKLQTNTMTKTEYNSKKVEDMRV